MVCLTANSPPPKLVVRLAALFCLVMCGACDKVQIYNGGDFFIVENTTEIGAEVWIGPLFDAPHPMLATGSRGGARPRYGDWRL